jgi:uncharacterized repeat protein (TIGR03803 family)
MKNLTQQFSNKSALAWFSPALLLVCLTAPSAYGDTDVKYEKTVLYKFTDGSQPNALIQDRDTNVLFGTTSNGGKTKQGSIFNITIDRNKPAEYKELYSFGIKGNQPSSYGLIQSKEIPFYGTSDQGGNTNNGTIFTYSPESGFKTVLFQFSIPSSSPLIPSGLIQASDGNFYGITQAGGADDKGTIFKYTRGIPNPLSIVHEFNGSDGTTPSSIIQANNGQFYGTTTTGGKYNKGTFFTMTPTGQLTTLYSFRGENEDGFGPQGIIQAIDGHFYGTAGGGQSSTGTIFHFSATGDLLKPLAVFLDGTTPRSKLIQTSNGYIYGSTQGNSILEYDPKQNTIYRINPTTQPTHVETLLEDVPASVLIQGHDGNFYGTESSITKPSSTIFKMSLK